MQFFAVSFALLFSTFALAQESKITNPSLEGPPTAETNELSSIKLSAPSSMQHQVRGEAKMESAKYATSIPGFEHLDQSQLATLDLQIGGLKSNGEKNYSAYKLDASFGKYLDWGNAYFSVQELYYNKAIDSTNWSAGRKIEFWSKVDSDWDLGFWSPSFNADMLRPKNQGLTGFFYRANNDENEVLVFVSPVFIPTMGPDIREDKGLLVSDSRWYRAPPASTAILNKDTKIVYSLDIPDLGRLAANPAFGTRIKMGGKGPGWWASMNAGFKPINSLSLKYDRKLWLGTSTSTGKAVVSPEVSYHTIAGVDVGRNFENGSHISLSVLGDRPETKLPKNDSEETDWVQQQPGSVTAIAAHADTKMTAGLDPIELSVDLLRVFEKLTVDYTADGVDSGSLFPYRTNYTNAISLKVQKAFAIRSTKINSSIKWLRDFDQQGTLIGFESAFYPWNRWAFHLGFDILGTDDKSNSNTDGRFLNQFRANDRVYGGVSYVF